MDNFLETYENFIKVREATRQGYAIAKYGDSINLEQPNSKTRRGRVGKQIANTLTCSCNQGVVVMEVDMNKLIQIGSLNGRHEQSNRIYSEEGLSPTIMAGSRKSCTGGYIAPKIATNIYKLNQLGFINSNKQGNRVYDEECSPTLRAIGGGLSKSSGLHLINNDFKIRGEMHMWKNKLEKFDFKMDELRLFDAFAGKGALHKSLKKLGILVKVIGLSEIEPDAIIAYAGVHIKGFKDLEFEFPSDEKMRELLMNRNIGWDFIKQKSSIPRMKKDKLKLLYKATILTNNLGDISKLDYDNMFDFDLFNLSFPCTDLSRAGKQKGLKNEDGTHTRSGLIKFGLDIVKAKKPKYIMIENVKALIQKKFLNDFYGIINEIESIGYKCFYPTKEDKKGNISPTCLNAKDFGIPQNRERIFVICVRNDVDIKFEFPKGFDKGIRLKDILEGNIDDKYYLSEEIQNRFKLNGKVDKNHNELNVVGSSAPECRTIGQRDMTYGVNGIMSTLTATDYKQPKQIIDNKNTNKVERIGGVFDKKDRIHQAGSVYNKECLSPTITTCEGGYRQPIVPDKYYIKKALNMEMKENYIQYDNSGKGYASQAARLYYVDKNMGSLPHCNTGDKTQIIEKEKNELDKEKIDGMNYVGDNHDFRIRKLTPLECWRLMGFDDEDFYNTKELGLSDSSLYKLAGNSIVVNCLYYIFKEVFKKYIIK